MKYSEIESEIKKIASGDTDPLKWVSVDPGAFKAIIEKMSNTSISQTTYKGLICGEIVVMKDYIGKEKWDICFSPEKDSRVNLHMFSISLSSKTSEIENMIDQHKRLKSKFKMED